MGTAGEPSIYYKSYVKRPIITKKLWAHSGLLSVNSLNNKRINKHLNWTDWIENLNFKCHYENGGWVNSKLNG